MKKFIIIVAAMLGVVAATSCSSCKEDVKSSNLSEFIYDITATAVGEGKFAWEAAPHMGDITLRGELVIEASNDTTATKVVFKSDAVNTALKLTDAVNSNDSEIANAAREAQRRLKTTHLEGSYQLDATGYVKYGPFYFVVDEHFPKVE